MYDILLDVASHSKEALEGYFEEFAAPAIRHVTHKWSMLCRGLLSEYQISGVRKQQR